MSNYSPKKQVAQAGGFKNSDSSNAHDPIKKVELNNVKEWQNIIHFYRNHIDLFIEDYFKEDLFDFQHLYVRETGNCNDTILIQSRSMGKTYVIALIALALGTLYSNSKIGITSKTLGQANLIIKYIEELAAKNPNINREIIHPIVSAKDRGEVKLRSGTKIETFALGATGDSARGKRYKIVIIDEARLVKESIIGEVIVPMLQYQRPVYFHQKKIGNEEYKDVPSKLIQISSAYLKTSNLYERFKFNVEQMKNDREDYFACALDYKPGVRHGYVNEDFVEDQRLKNPTSMFMYEWGSIFVGASEATYFPFEIIEPCKKLANVELSQPKGSQSRYVISVDPAVSEKTTGDNACFMVFKLKEKADGTFLKELVYMKTYHGIDLDIIVEKIRELYLRFPNTEKIVIDINGIGRGLPSLLDSSWVDEESNKEFPPLVPDNDERRKAIPNAKPILRTVIPTGSTNIEMGLYLKTCLQNKSLLLPVSFADMRSMTKKSDKKKNREDLLEEESIYIEGEALMFEVSNIRQVESNTGNLRFERIEETMRKDRYTCLAMGLHYVKELEEENKEKYHEDDFCLGMATRF